MSRTLVNPISDLFDVACRHHTVKVSCQCGNVGIFDPHALWYLFERKGWTDRLLVDVDHTRQLPMPPISEWKRQLRRRR